MSVLLLTHAARTLVVALAAIAFGGCNLLLDNRPGDLSEGRVGTDPADAGEATRVAERDAGASGPTDEPLTDAADPVPPPCLLGTRLCRGICVSTNDAHHGCGGPTCEPCAIDHATAACASMACAIAKCDPGWADCNGDPDDGCESNLLQDKRNCGVCGWSCLVGKCRDGACRLRL